jgi:SAM-dependent methyltransferase
VTAPAGRAPLLGARVSARLRRLRKRLANGLDALETRIRPDPTQEDLKRRVGGRWDEIGRLQFDFLVAEGLRPEHTLLDVGCGVMRGGLHFVRYLEPGNYYGIDISEHMIAGARRELEAAGLGGRDAQLRVTDRFDVDFGRPIDYALAQSVFTHLPLNSIARALTALAGVLAPGGRFYATFFRGPAGPDRFVPVTQPAHDGYVPVVTTADGNPYHYAVEDLVWVCRELPLAVEDVGDWKHPRGQQMLRFTRE